MEFAPQTLNLSHGNCSPCSRFGLGTHYQIRRIVGYLLSQTLKRV